MDIKERLRRINANSFYGVGPIDRDRILKEAEEILRRKKMAEMNNSEWFVKTVENTANSAIAAGRDVNEVIHDTIEVLYGRKNINELLPKGWIVVSHNCSDCAYVHHPSHYETGKFECIDVMLETQGKEAVKDFCVCNAFKYLYRHGNKNGLEDIKKAVWYLNKFIELEEN